MIPSQPDYPLAIFAHSLCNWPGEPLRAKQWVARNDPVGNWV
ncbi:hypothetical protein [Trueperella sp. LYQ143]